MTFLDANIVPLEIDNVVVQPIQAAWLSAKNISLDVLRLDKIHPVVSGNKWFKLQQYLEDAVRLKKQTIATFGGAYSNHIVATAFTCKQYKLNSVGIIRGEAEAHSHTLEYAKGLGMRLHFASRDDYKHKLKLKQKFDDSTIFWIEEGGYGDKGAVGASSILSFVNAQQYDVILAAVGTGTMLAGLITAADKPVIGVSSMKANSALESAVRNLLPPHKLSTPFSILHDYHFGGYGKHPEALLDFINETYVQHQLPLDIVYTGKLFYAIKDLINKNHFTSHTKLLMIHSGGLQGNQSLPQGRLSFL